MPRYSPPRRTGARPWQLAGVLLLVPFVASAQTDDRIRAVELGLLPVQRVNGIDTRWSLEKRMRHYRVPGVSIAVIDDYRIVWAKGYGERDADSRLPVDTGTLFQAASISKPVAVAGALVLVERGVLDLDSDVNRYLRSWRLPESEFASGSPVTLRAIMSHTAGLTVHGFPGYGRDALLPTVAQVLDGLAPANTEAVRVDQRPGSGFRYSGGGTTVLQQAVVDVTGQPFAAFMQATVLEPAGMPLSTYEQPLPEARWADAATAHNTEGQPVPGGWHVYPEQAAAGLWTTPSDLARFAIELQRAFADGSGHLLSQRMVREMLTAQNGGPVGLGLFLEGEGQARRFSHGGSNAGFRCLLVGYVNTGSGAVVMTNGSQGGDLAAEIARGIAAVYGWAGYLRPERFAIALPADAYEQYVGRYQFPDRIVTVRRDGQYLVAEAPGRPTVWLLPEATARFFGTNELVEVEFAPDPSGRGFAMLVRRGGREFRGVLEP